MAGVNGVSARVKQLDALRDAESGPDPLTTANVLKQVQQDSGFHHQTTIRGDDATLRELIDDQKGLRENIAGLVALAAKVAEGAELTGVAHGLLAGAGGAALSVAAPVVGLGAMTYEVLEAGEKGRAQAETLYRDQTHVAMLVSLKLPTGFTTAELKK